MYQHDTPTMLVDLDALRHGEKTLVPWTPPAVIDGVIVTHPHVSPLAADTFGVYPTALRGGVVTDPAEIERIGARVAAATRPWHRHRAPKGTPVPLGAAAVAVITCVAWVVFGAAMAVGGALGVALNVVALAGFVALAVDTIRVRRATAHAERAEAGAR